MNLRTLIDELGRRRVTRVAVAYVVIGFGVIQAADLILPRLLLPDWTVTLVLVLTLLGFPAAIALAWALDVTPDGIRRTPALAERSDAPGAQRAQRRVRLGFAVLVLLVVGTAGWLALRRERASGDVALDAQLLAVMPFRVQGADASLAYLREGMMDLLAAKLTAVPRAVDVRAVLGAYERELRAGDATPDRIARVARDLHAARFATGVVVGSPTRVSVSLTLHDARTGRAIADASTDGPADSLSFMTDRLIATLLGRELREAEHRLDILGATAFPAVRLYLEGKALYRRGRYDEALERFGAALGMDSTFALAALGVAESSNMTFGSADRARPALLTAFAHQDRLSAADRRYLLARLGPRHPAPPTLRDLMENWELLTREQPDRAEVWYEYADLIHHRGSFIGMPDHFDRADALFDRVLELDPGFYPAMQHRFFAAVGRQDTASARRYGAGYLALDSVGHTADFTRVMVFIALRDSSSMQELARSLETMNHDILLALAGMHLPAPHAEWDTLHARIRTLARERTRGEAERRRLLEGDYAAALTRGRPAEAARILDRLLAGAPADTVLLTRGILAGLYWEGDSAQAARSVARMQRATPRVDGSPVEADAACAIAQWQLWNGGHDATAEAARRMRAAVPANGPASLTGWRAHVCAALLDAGLAVLTRRPDARDRVLALDSIMLLGPPVADIGRFVGNMVATRLLELIGETQRARDASVREVVGPNMELFYGPRLREKARLADAVGDRAAAIRHYTEYLELRRDAEPGPVAGDRTVRDALARLVGEHNATGAR